MSQIRKYLLTRRDGMIGLTRLLDRTDFTEWRTSFNQGAAVLTVTNRQDRLVRHQLRIIIPHTIDDDLHDELLEKAEAALEQHQQATEGAGTHE